MNYYTDVVEISHVRGIEASSEKVSIKNARFVNGLPELQIETINCLSCNRKFKSYDKRHNRVCPRCKKRQQPDYSEYPAKGVIICA